EGGSKGEPWVPPLARSFGSFSAAGQKMNTSYRPVRRYFCNLLIVLQDDISVIFLSSLTDNISIASIVQLTIIKNHFTAFSAVK
ncbi:MAG: hypothetical protein SO125_06115, partial [Eubacteriales bacterium]|nr:hypothetical protein [Eubacteriales bacterium]